MQIEELTALKELIEKNTQKNYKSIELIGGIMALIDILNENAANGITDDENVSEFRHFLVKKREFLAYGD